MTVDAEQNQDEVNKEVQSKIENGYNIYYTVYKNGNHRYTWQHAYNMKPAMEWLFKQKRHSSKMKQNKIRMRYIYNAFFVCIFDKFKKFNTKIKKFKKI